MISQYKTELFSFLFEKIDTELIINKTYNVITSKDKLVEYFQKNYPKNKITFVSEISSFYKQNSVLHK